MALCSSVSFLEFLNFNACTIESNLFDCFRSNVPPDLSNREVNNFVNENKKSLSRTEIPIPWYQFKSDFALRIWA